MYLFIFKIRIYFLFTLTTLQTNTEVFLRFNAFMNSSLLWIWSNKCPFLCECCIIISLQLPMLSIKKFIKGYYQLVRCGSIKDQDGFQLEFVSISQVINHMTCYKFECSHWWKIYFKKNPLQDLLSSLNAVISTN